MVHELAKNGTRVRAIFAKKNPAICWQQLRFHKFLRIRFLDVQVSLFLELMTYLLQLVVMEILYS